MQLSELQLQSFRDRGFLAIPDALPPSAIGEVRRLLDPLFERIDQLDPGLVRDIADGHSGTPRMARSPEINRARRLEPRLARTEAFAVCKRLGAQLSPGPSWYSYDHAIYKQPFNNAETPWHQDQAYAGSRQSLNTFHFWIPLQDVDERNGCMSFVPGSHKEGFREHHRRNHDPRAHALETDQVDTSQAVACPLSAGGLTIHTPLTLHYTAPNDTAEVRRAWILHFGPYGQFAKLKPRLLFNRLVSAISYSA